MTTVRSHEHAAAVDRARGQAAVDRGCDRRGATLLTFMLIGGPTLGGLVAAVIGLAITAFLIAKIAKAPLGRIVLLVLFVLGVGGFFLGPG